MAKLSIIRSLGVSLIIFMRFMLTRAAGALEVDSICSMVDQCDTSPRQIMFLLDGSNTMNIEAFNDEMLSFIQKMHCIFPEGATPKVGLIVFNSKIDVVIPLANHSLESWIAAVEALRDTGLCCSCCTPHAEAFEAAHSEFAKFADEDALRTTVVVTDGVSHQNDGNGKYNRNKMPHAFYKAVTVPKTANKLKDDYDARIVVVNVPRKDGILTDLSFFLGNMSDPEFCSDNKNLKGANYNDFGCKVKDNGKTCCIDVKSPPFPVVSTPLKSNICTLRDFTSTEVHGLIDRTTDVICNEAWVPTCKAPPRDIFFIVDASNSMSPTRFQNEMMTLVNNVFSSLDARLNNRVGLILFGYNARVVIPLAQYSLIEFEAQIELIRSDNIQSGSEQGACCACCTPTAEAFELARAEFLGATGDGRERVAFMLTDGVPSRLRGDSKWGQDTISEQEYRDEIVPEQARLLQEIARVVMLGVKNKHGALPAESYFKEKMIASQPVDFNVHSSNTWDLKDLTQTVFDMLCGPLPTASPTQTPPTEQPTPFMSKTINEWQGGWVDGSGNCDDGYQIRQGGTTYGPFNGCVSLQEFTPHLGQDNGANLISPDTANRTLWCPYNLNGVVYETSNTNIRKQWGYCHTFVTTRPPSPTAEPTREPTSKPTRVPTSATPGPTPETGSPTTATPGSNFPTTTVPKTSFPTTAHPTSRPTPQPSFPKLDVPLTLSPTQEPTGIVEINTATNAPSALAEGHGCSLAASNFVDIATVIVGFLISMLL